MARRVQVWSALIYLCVHCCLSSLCGAARLEGPPSTPGFPLGVASGDPRPHGFVLMTHLDRQYLYGDHPHVMLEISSDPDFRQLVLNTTLELDPGAQKESSEITIKTTVDSPRALKPFSYYYYRFRYLQYLSPVGRAHTLPAAAAELKEITLGVVTCQDYTTGNYHAFSYLADEPADYIVHLGDAIYEYSRYPGMPDHDIVRTIDLPQGVRGLYMEAKVLKATTLADYRLIYRTQRGDPALQQVLRSHTWIYTHDDHEFADNSFWDYDNDAPGFPEHDVRRHWSPQQRRGVFLNAVQSWSEYIPMPGIFNQQTDIHSAAASFYKVYHLGTLIDLYALAGRLFRSDPCAKGQEKTMLGSVQKAWLLRALNSSRSTWQVVANQTLFSRLTLGVGKKLSKIVNRDAWDGFPRERDEIVDMLARKAQVAIFTGDMHTSLVSYIKSDYYQSAKKNRQNIVGAEFMTPSISSPNFSDSIRAMLGFTGATALVRAIFEGCNSHIKHFHGGLYGYALATITPQQLDWYVYKIGKKVMGEKILRKHMTYFPRSKKLVTQKIPSPTKALQF